MPENTRLRRNKNKAAYRLLFFVFVLCLIVYFWLFVAKAIDQNAITITFCYLFLVGGSVVLGWRMQQEPDFEIDLTEPESDKKIPGEDQSDSAPFKKVTKIQLQLCGWFEYTKALITNPNQRFFYAKISIDKRT